MSARKIENGPGDSAASRLDTALNSDQIVGVQHDQRSARPWRRLRRESSRQPAIGKFTISRTVIFERPPEGFAIERLGAFDVSYVHLDVVDTTIIHGLSHQRTSRIQTTRPAYRAGDRMS